MALSIAVWWVSKSFDLISKYSDVLVASVNLRVRATEKNPSSTERFFNQFIYKSKRLSDADMFPWFLPIEIIFQRFDITLDHCAFTKIDEERLECFSYPIVSMGWPLRYGSINDTPKNGVDRRRLGQLLKRRILRQNLQRSRCLYLIELAHQTPQSETEK